MKTVLSAVALVVLAGVAAQAQSNQFELSGGYSVFDLKRGDLNALTVRGTYNFTEHFGAEAEGSFGIKDDTVTIGGLTGDVKLKHALAAYGRAQYPLGEQFSVFARVGYSTIKVDADESLAVTGETESGLAYGVGAQWNFMGNNGLRFDYTRHNEANTDQWTLSYGYRF